MKTGKLIHDGGLRMTLMSMLALFAFSNCSAQPSATDKSDGKPSIETCEGFGARMSKRQNFIMKEMINPIVKDSLGDSICSIIVSSKKIKVERLITNQSQSPKMTARWLSKGEIDMAIFLLMANDSITSQSLVFGKYSPNVKFTFFSKKSFVIVEIDFGLQQVCFIGKDIKKFDLRENYLLKFCNMLFPNDKYLSFLLKERTK